ncbi:E3 ubiquitin-protein ligase MIB2-like protein, partial [Leptotrombidium deliense]
MAYKQQQLFRFCSTGNVSEVKRLIYNENVNLHARDEKGNSCVHSAARSNQHKVLQLLIKIAADLNAVNNDGFSPLHSAIYSGAECCVSLLLKEHILVNRFNNEGLTELMLAVQIRENLDPPHQFAIIKQLLNHDEIDLRAISRDRQRQSALHYAAFCGNVFAVKRILEKDASLHELQNAFKNLPIHLAASSRNNDVIKAIYQKVPNLDINVKGHKSVTPLQMALKFGHFSTVELLVHLKADCNAFDRDGNTALHMAVEAFNDCCHGTKKLRCVQKGNDSKEIKRIRESLSTTLQINCSNLAVVFFLIEN